MDSVSRPLQGRVALVTGGSRNIGRCAALALGRAGADVVVTYRERAQAAAEVVGELQALGVRAEAVQADLSVSAAVEPLVSALRRTLVAWDREGLDVLVNNAGTMRLATFDQVTEADLDANYQLNFKGVFLLTQALMPVLRDGGRIVNLGSGTARIAFAPLVSYGPQKAALHSLTLYLAAFFGPRGITVNAIAPGGLDDDFNAPLFARMPAAHEFIRSHTAVGRVGVPSDVGDVIAFLCSPQAAFVSGAVLPVDGGYHL